MIQKSVADSLEGSPKDHHILLFMPWYSSHLLIFFWQIEYGRNGRMSFPSLVYKMTVASSWSLSHYSLHVKPASLLGVSSTFEIHTASTVGCDLLKSTWMTLDMDSPEAESSGETAALADSLSQRCSARILFRFLRNRNHEVINICCFKPLSFR